MDKLLSIDSIEVNLNDIDRFKAYSLMDKLRHIDRNIEELKTRKSQISSQLHMLIGGQIEEQYKTPIPGKVVYEPFYGDAYCFDHELRLHSLSDPEVAPYVR